MAADPREPSGSANPKRATLCGPKARDPERFRGRLDAAFVVTGFARRSAHTNRM
jgi:hypothetical protein